MLLSVGRARRAADRGGGALEARKGAGPGGAKVHGRATGWNGNYKSGLGVDTISSGIEGAWTSNPIKWDMGYFDNLFGYDWELTKSPAGAHQWKPKRNGHDIEMTPDAHDRSKKNLPMMQTTDLSLKLDPKYGPISKHFHQNPNEFADAFARAWFKLTHRDMGPKANYLGSDVPKEELIWQDPITKNKYKLKNKDIELLKKKINKSGLTVSQLVTTAWASASTFRGSDKRGGANGARIALEPQKDWEVNNPSNLSGIITDAADFDVSSGGAFYQSVEAANEFDVLVASLNQLALSNYQASYIMLHPTDFHKILLLKDTQNNYLKDQVYSGLQPNFMGVPVIINNAISAGSFLCGNFNVGTQLWIRDNVNVEFFREDGTNVRDGFVTVRVSERIALTNYLPNAFVNGSFSTATAALETP